MKKQYIAPKVEIETIDTENLLAAVSDGGIGIDSGDSSDIMESKGHGLGHSFDIWGLDDEEED